MIAETKPASEQHGASNHIPGFFQQLKQWLLGS
jgi:hypothetical protein